MLIPKRDYLTICLMGKEIDDNLLQSFLTAPEVSSCFPQGWRWDEPACHCAPRIQIGAAVRPFADRLVFIGDSGASRLKKDGIGAAYRTAKAAASCAIMAGISAEDFRRYYAPFCRRMEVDNHFGRLVFFMARIIQRLRFSRRALLHMVVAEQLSPGISSGMSSVLWDTFTGSAPYQEVFLRTLHPAFIGRYLRSLAGAAMGG
jgi:flavin-dependent dehydrogenase